MPSERIEFTGSQGDVLAARLDRQHERAQRQRLLEIAEKCPVHRTLHSEVLIESRLTDQL